MHTTKGEHMTEEDDDTQVYKKPWVDLTEEELLQAYGWRLASGAPNWLLEEAKQELLGALRKVEAKLKEKNA
jgi:predicted DNA-binding transcriptional regulator